MHFAVYFLYSLKGLFQKDSKRYLEPQIRGLLEFDWALFCEEQKKALRGETWAFKEKAMIFVDGELLGKSL